MFTTLYLKDEDLANSAWNKISALFWQSKSKAFLNTKIADIEGTYLSALLTYQ
jgi:hypothetical protein